MTDLPARLFVALRVAHAGPVAPAPYAGPQMPRIAPLTYLATGARGFVVGVHFGVPQSPRLDHVVDLTTGKA